MVGGLPVSRASLFLVILSESDRAALERQARSYTASHAKVIRAKIVLLAAAGGANAAIAQRLDLHVDVGELLQRVGAHQPAAALVLAA